MFVAVDGTAGRPARRRRSDQGDDAPRRSRRCTREGLRDRHAHRRQPRRPPRPWRAQLGIDEVDAEVLPEQKARRRRAAAGARAASSRWPATASTTRRRWRRPTSASRWAPAPTSRWRAPASRWCKGDLRGIVRARRLSRATMRNIRQNLFFAFVYNALGVPIAAGVLYPFVRPAAQPDDRQRGDEPQLGVGDRATRCGCGAPPSERRGRYFPRRSARPRVDLELLARFGQFEDLLEGVVAR